jgi:hypothetical protein
LAWIEFHAYLALAYLLPGPAIVRNYHCLDYQYPNSLLNELIIMMVYTLALVTISFLLKDKHMLNPKKLEEIAKQISDSVPQGMKDMAEGAETRVKQILQNQISRLDFVSREEFDVQTQVLIRTREKLAALEARISALEASSTED